MFFCYCDICWEDGESHCETVFLMLFQIISIWDSCSHPLHLVWYSTSHSVCVYFRLIVTSQWRTSYSCCSLWQSSVTAKITNVLRGNPARLSRSVPGTLSLSTPIPMAVTRKCSPCLYPRYTMHLAININRIFHIAATPQIWGAWSPTNSGLAARS